MDASGNLYITGEFSGTVDFDPGVGTANLTSSGGTDIFVQKLNSSGSYVWAEAFSGTGSNTGNDIAVDASGNVYITGNYLGTVDFDPGVGTSNLTSSGAGASIDIFVARLDTAGAYTWAVSMGGAIGTDRGHGIVVDSLGNVYTTGRFQDTGDFDPGVGTSNLTSLGSYDVFVSKLDSSGNFVWAKVFGNTGSDRAWHVDVDGANNVYTVGGFQDTVDFEPGAGTFNVASAGARDMFIHRLNADGTFGWVKTMGALNNDEAFGIRVSADGDVYASGRFQDTVDFDPGAGTANLVSLGGYDVFALVFNPVAPTADSIVPETFGPTTLNSVEFTFGFSENVLNFNDAADLVITHSGTAHTGETFGAGTVTLNGISGDGTITMAVNTGSDVTNDVGIPLASSVTSSAVTIDNTYPLITVGTPSEATTQNGPVSFPVTVFDANLASTNLTLSFITLNTTGDATGTVSITDPTTTTPTVTVSSITGDGTIGITVNADFAHDMASQSNQSSAPSATVTVDSTYNSGTLSVGAPSATQTISGPVTFGLTYTNASSVNLTAGDITLNTQGTATGLVSVSNGTTTTPTVTIHTISGDGALSIDVASGTALDNGSNPIGGATSAVFGVGNSASYKPVTYDFVTQFGDVGEEYTESLVVDGSGNMYIVGDYQGTVDFDPGVGVDNHTSIGDSDIVIIKLDDNGDYVWAKSVGGTGADFPFDVALDSNGDLCIVGQFENLVDFDPSVVGISDELSNGQEDVFILKLDSDGNFIWVEIVGGTDRDRAYAVDTDVNDNIYVTGTFRLTTDFNPQGAVANLTSIAGDDLFVLKLDSSGIYQWAKSIGGTDTDRSYDIAVDDSGNVYTTGEFALTVDFDPGVGVDNHVASNLGGVFVSKLDTDGNHVWASTASGALSSQGYGIAVDDSGNVYTTGYSSDTMDFDPGAGTANVTNFGGRDIFLWKLDSNGDYVWAKGMGSTQSDFAQSIALDDQNNIYIAGSFDDTVDFDPGVGTFNMTSAGEADIFVSKFTPAGEFIWANSMGGTLRDRALNIFVTTHLNLYNTIYTSGYFNGTADFDPGVGVANLTSNGAEDMFIHRMQTVIDPTLPTATSIVPVTTGPTNVGSVDFTVTFSEDVVSFNDASDVVVDHSGTAHSGVSISGGPSVYTVSITGITGDGAFTVTADWSSDIQDLSGNGLDASATSAAVAIDNTNPTMVIGPPSIGATTSGPVSYTVTYSGADSVNLNVLDITLNTTGTATGIASVTNGNTNTPTVTLHTISGDGTLGFSIDPATATDTAGNAEAIGATSSVVAVNSGPNTNPLVITGMGGTGREYGEAISYDSSGNMYVAGSFEGTVDADPGPVVANHTSNGDEDVIVMKLDTYGNLIWSKSLGGSLDDNPYAIEVDSAGNVYILGVYESAFDADPGVGVSNLTSVGETDLYVSRLAIPSDPAPTADVITPVTTGPTNVTSVDFTITFSEDVQNFNDAADVVIGHSGTSHSGVSISGGPSVYTASVTGLSGTGSFTFAVDTTSDVESLGSIALASSVTSAAVTLDNTGPGISIGAPSATVSTGASVSYLVTYSDANSVNLTAGDITLNTEGNAGGSVSVTNGTTTTPTVTINSVSGNGTIGFSIGANTASDALGNTAAASGNSATFDMFTELVTAGVGDADFESVHARGGTGNDYARNIKTDAAGNVYVVGSFSDSVDIDLGASGDELVSVGGEDAFVLKYDDSLNLVWIKQFSGTGDEFAYGLDLDNSGNVFVSGYFEGSVDFDPGVGSDIKISAGLLDTFVVKLDSNGVYQWSNTIGGSSDNDLCYSVAVDSSGNAYVTGVFNGVVDFDPGVGTANLDAGITRNIFVAKYSSNGNYIWAEQMVDDDITPSLSYAIDVDTSGNVYTTGYYYSTVDFDPGAGTSQLTTASSSNIFISKLSSTGTFVWAHDIGDSGVLDGGQGITTDAAGNVYVTGYFSSTTDFDPGAGTVSISNNGNKDIFTLKMNASGVLQWATGAGDTSIDSGKGIAVDSSGHVFVSGNYGSAVDFDPGAGSYILGNAGGSDAFVQKFSSTGSFLWAKGVGGPGTDSGFGVAVDSLFNV